MWRRRLNIFMCSPAGPWTNRHRLFDSCTRHPAPSAILWPKESHISLAAAVRRWPFATHALMVALAVAVVTDFGVFRGRVPLPADLLGWFPAWEGAQLSARPADARFAEEGDLITLMYPWRAYLGESLKKGQLPYWNPHIMMGTPFLADPISAVFYAPNWLFAILRTHWAWSVQFPVRAALAVFFAAMLARVIGASRTGALLAGVVFSLSGFMTAWQGWPQADCLLWTPLIMLSFFAIRRRPTARRGALLGLTLTFPLLAGHPEVGLYALAIGFGFGAVMLVSAWRGGRSGRWVVRFGRSILLGLVLAGGICAVQLVPTMQWLPQITRTLTQPWGPLAQRDIVSLISRDARSNPNSAGVHVPEECSYPSVAALLLAPLALFHRRRGVAVYFGLVALFAVEVTVRLPAVLPTFPRHAPVQGLPGNRLLGIFDLSVAMLGGLGLTVLQQRRRDRRARVGILTVLTAASIGLAALAVELQRRLFVPGRDPRREWIEFTSLAGLGLERDPDRAALAEAGRAGGGAARRRCGSRPRRVFHRPRTHGRRDADGFSMVSGLRFSENAHACPESEFSFSVAPPRRRCQRLSTGSTHLRVIRRS